jgi:hypothetical protein
MLSSTEAERNVPGLMTRSRTRQRRRPAGLDGVLGYFLVLNHVIEEEPARLHLLKQQLALRAKRADGAVTTRASSRRMRRKFGSPPSYAGALDASCGRHGLAKFASRHTVQIYRIWYYGGQP